MTDQPKREPWSREVVLLAWTLVATIFIAIVAIWAALDAHWGNENLLQVISNKDTTISAANKEIVHVNQKYAAIANINLESFLRQYNTYIIDLKTAGDAYDASKSAAGEGGEGKRATARRNLDDAIDKFTTFISRWRQVAEPLDKLLDGNVTRLINSRQIDNVDDARETARRIVDSAPSLAEPLQVALNQLKAGAPDNQKQLK